jgi:hypothetical protein
MVIGCSGRIENHVQIMDGTAAVSADAGNGTKVGHWDLPRRQFPAVGKCSGKRKSEDLLCERKEPPGFAVSF